MKNARTMLTAGLSAAAALTLVLTAPLSASAATVTETITNGGTPPTISTGATGAHTVELSGSGFDVTPDWYVPFSPIGFYVAFGPEADITDVYADQAAFSAEAGGIYWVHPGADTSGGDQWELTTAGAFSDLPLAVSSTFVDGNSVSHTCTTSPTDTTAGRVDCYIYTFSAHGSWDRGNDNKIPVYFG